MAWFQLDPAAIAGRASATRPSTHVPSLADSLARGVIGFTVVNLAGFAPWVFCGRWFYRLIGPIRRIRPIGRIQLKQR